VKAAGVRIAVKEVASLKLRSVKEVVKNEEPSLFDAAEETSPAGDDEPAAIEETSGEDQE
jgi:hypothetical protein